jgi:TolB protein
MKRLLVLLPLLAAGAFAQTQITTSIGPNQSAKSIAIIVPRPDTALPIEAYNAPFFAPLTRDLAASGVFALTPYPPGVPIDAELAKRVNAQFILLTSIKIEEKDYVIDARLIDTTNTTQFGKRYRGTQGALTRMAHIIANDLVRMANGKPAVFLSQIAFASNRDGNFEIYLMDWDGGNQRRITRHNALSILPSWAPDNERIVYTSFFGGTSDMYIISRRGGGRIKLRTGLNLNTSATFSPVGSDIAFVGSINGNPDIYLVKDDGTNIRRLTTDSSIESTPEWSPNGRQISFTSGRGGSPQIYIMDAEGSNVRRMSFEGDWNDDATWSPNGDEIAYTSKVNGRFQIRIQNVVTGQSRIVAGEGSNEQPAWAPDGQWLAFQSNRSGVWQIYRMRVDGSQIQQLTFDGENKDPDWSKKAE